MPLDCRLLRRTVPLLSVLCGALMVQPAGAQIGTVLSGAGPINRSFGGVGVAAPLSPAGPLFWNPAALSGLERSELETGAELLFPHSTVRSRISAGSLGPGVPPIDLSGSTDSDSGAFPLPTIALAYTPECSRLTWGLGVFALAGFGVDYPGDAANPLLSARPPGGLGFGPVYSEFQVLQITPAVSWQVTERLSVGVGPTVNLAMLSLDPAIFASPDDANTDTFFTYPAGTHSRPSWGGGINAGAYYQADCWSVGASIKSPQWFDTFRFNSLDELGFGRTLTFELELPLIASVGAAWTGRPGWTFAADVRYLDYENADGLGDAGFNPTGALRGVGWESIFAAAFGVQYAWSDSLSLRLGYTWNENPIPGGQSTVNTPAPVILEHTIYAGASWQVTQDFSLSIAYGHAFENSIEGPLVTPAGALPGSSVYNSASGDFVVFGANVRFGGCRHRGTCYPCIPEPGAVVY